MNIVSERKLLSTVSKITSRNNIFIAGGLLVFTLFHIPIQDALSTYFVSPLFAYVPQKHYIDILFAIVKLVLIFWFGIQIYVRSIPLVQRTVWIVVISFIYLIYRTREQPWIFTRYLTWEKVAYADVILLISGLVIIRQVAYAFSTSLEKRQTENISDLFDDSPLGEGEDVDQFGYTTYAERLADNIERAHFKKSFAIAVNGKWGTGKTSFLNLIKNKLSSNSNVLLIDFNPWKTSNPTGIIRDFFDSIHNEISPYSSSLSNQLLLYANKLIQVKDDAVANTVKILVESFVESESLSDQQKQINETLRQLGKKLVVIIDDVDRLDRSEIIEVIRLIRNNANFYNTYFIVAYDRNYVLESLRGSSLPSFENYLEKIFQIEVTLPYFEPSVLRQTLYRKLSTKLPDEPLEIFQKFLVEQHHTEVKTNWLESMRDVSRLANSICLNFKELLGDVYVADLINMELLRIKYPSVYETFFKQPALFIEHKQRGTTEYSYELKKTYQNRFDQMAGKPSDHLNNSKTVLEEYIRKNKIELGVRENEFDKIVALLNHVFDGRPFKGHGLGVRHSIVYSENFERYYAYRLLEGELSDNEFFEAANNNIDSFKNKIEEWVDRNLEEAVKRKFEVMDSYPNREFFEKVIESIFHLARLKSHRRDPSFYKVVFYDFDDLHYKLHYNRFIEKFYGSKDSTELKQFVITLLSSAEPPYHFDANLLEHINNKSNDVFPLDRDERLAFLHRYLVKVCELSDDLRVVFPRYYDCYYQDFMMRRIKPEAKEIMFKFFSEKGLDQFIDQLRSYEDKYSVKTPDVFESYDDFHDFLFKQDENRWRYLAEFKLFFQAFRDAGNQPVPFEFNVMSNLKEQHDN